MSKARIGLICSMSPELHDVWGEEVRAPAREMFAEAQRRLEGFGVEVIAPAEFTTSVRQAREHGRMLRHAGIHVLVVYVARWSYGTSVVETALECDVPVVVWTGTDIAAVGIVGASVVRGSLDEAGITNCLVYGDFDDAEALQELEVRCLGAAAGSSLRGQIYGLMGSRSLGMLTAAVDANQWRRQFGVEVESWDQSEIIDLAQKMPDAEVDSHLAWSHEVFGSIQVKDKVMRAALKMYLASRRIIAERGFDFVSVRCLPETPVLFTTFCYTIALLNDTSDADGDKDAICCSCESDSNGALTMQILKHLGGAPIMFGDVRTIRLVEGEIWISNCGSQATTLAKGPQAGALGGARLPGVRMEAGRRRAAGRQPPGPRHAGAHHTAGRRPRHADHQRRVHGRAAREAAGNALGLFTARLRQAGCRPAGCGPRTAQQPPQPGVW